MIFWDLKTVCAMAGLSESSVRRMTKAGTFPSSHKLIGRRRVWNPTDVRNWAEGILCDRGQNKPEKSPGILSKFL